MHLDDITSALPSLVDDPETTDLTPSSGHRQPDIAAFIHTLRLRSMNGQIQRELYRPTSNLTFSELTPRKMTAMEADLWRKEMKTRLDEWASSHPVRVIGIICLRKLMDIDHSRLPAPLHTSRVTGS